MELTAEQKQYAQIIDKHVSQYPDTTLGSEHLLGTVYDYMDAFKLLIGSLTPVELDYVYLRYPGVYRLGLLLQVMAEGIDDGSISAPNNH